jgi:SAM-dependent methyltransferase
LQVGTWGPAQHLLGGARTQHTTLLAPGLSPGVTLCAPPASLPFASDSIDAVFLPHTLELVEDPYAVLREAERVLCAEGCLMICGFNPFSGWGARRLFAQYFRQRAFPPETRRMLSERRLRDWMALLDFEVASVYGYLGPIPVTRRPRKLADGTVRQAEYRSRRPLTAGAYLLKARKRVQTLTLVRPKRRSRQRVLVPATEPTTKVGSRKVGSGKAGV